MPTELRHTMSRLTMLFHVDFFHYSYLIYICFYCLSSTDVRAEEFPHTVKLAYGLAEKGLLICQVWLRARLTKVATLNAGSKVTALTLVGESLYSGSEDGKIRVSLRLSYQKQWCIYIQHSFYLFRNMTVKKIIFLLKCYW